MLRTLLHGIAGVWTDLAPSLLLGLLVAGILRVFLRRDRITKSLGRPGPLSSARAALLGVPMPLCSCGVVPAAVTLRREGASPGAATSFLVTTPETGIESVILTAGMLGWAVAAVKVIASVVAGFVSGVVVDAIRPGAGTPPVDPSGGACTREEEAAGPIARLWRYSFGVMLRDLYGVLVIGTVVSAILGTFLPAGSLEGVPWVRGPLGLLAALALGIPLYVCSTASVPLAASLVHAGLPTGAAVVFLMAGPATNAASLGAVRKTMGSRVLAIYLSSIVLFSLLAGLVLEGISPEVPVHATAGVEPLYLLRAAAGVLLAAGIAWLAGADLVSWARRRLAGRFGRRRLTISVSEVCCEGCMSEVREALMSLEGVRSAVVARGRGTVALSAGPGFDAARALETLRGLGHHARLV